MQSAPRVPHITGTEGLSTEQRAVWDEIVQTRGRLGGPYPVLLHSPELARRTARLGAFVRWETSLPKTAGALACLITARHFDCQYEWSGNEPKARQAGVRSEAIAAIRDRRAPDGLDGEERAVFALVDELLTDNRINPATFQEGLRRYGVVGMVDLIGCVGYFANIAMTLNAFDMDSLPFHPRLLPATR